MANRNRNASAPYVTYHTRLGPNGKPRRNKDGSLSILTLVRVPKLKRISQTFKTQAEAEAWAVPLAKELVEQAKRGARPSLPTLTVAQLINQYLDDPKTEELTSYEDYAARAHWWRRHYGDERVLEFDVTALDEARDSLRSSGRHGKRKNGTVNRYLAVMRLIWNWGRATKWIPLTYVWPTRLMLNEPDGRIRFLSDEELAALLKVAEPDPVMHTAILVSISTGIRQSELLRLKWPDVDLTKAHLTVYKSKNKTPKRIHLTREAITALEGLKAAKVRSPVHVFLNEEGAPLTRSKLLTRWRRIRKAAKLVDFRWHDLRHTSASYLAQGGSTLLEIGSVLGHRSPTSTNRYAHFIQGAPVKGHASLDAKLRGG